MGIRNILVHLDNLDTSGPRLKTAIQYARKHEAHLRGLYLTTYKYFEPRTDSERSDYAKAEEIFKWATATAGVSSEWIEPRGNSLMTDIMTVQAYYTDLVIVGQPNFHPPNLNIPPELPEHLIKSCGRPVLVIPYAGKFETAGDRIMIAWRAGRESVRSVNDAMPCIEKAQHVSVVEVSSEAIPPESNEQIINIREFIALHKAIVRTEQVYAGDFTVGDTILNIACEKTIDLLVMGAYAQSRKGTLTLSPIASHVLRHLTVPVLMSH